jgi:Tol biopolymer transport system component
MVIAPGTRFGPYEILALIGAGGMGEVYRARDTRLGREVAVKILPASMAADPERLRRFEQEARATGALNHPNILAIYDIGLEHGSPYLVSELLEGETLRARLHEGALAPRKALDYAIQIGHGLTAAHARGIVHRDLKPENVFITQAERVKILDFGLAKNTMASAAPAGQSGFETITQPGLLIGTVGYMSPEQVRGEPADHRSDIFSFGAIFYEMLTGKPAFHDDTAAETMSAILRKDPPALLTIERSLPPTLERVVRHCLEKDPNQRFHSARDLAFALEAISEAPSSAAQEAVAGVAEPAPSKRRRAGLLFAGGLALGLLLGAALVVWIREPQVAEIHASLRYLTYSGHDSSPAVSPDGRTIAFTSDRDGRSRIWLKQLPAGGEVALTQGPDVSARFSPDGAMILFLRNEGSRTALYRTAVLAPEPRKLMDDVASADWSPDGSQIAFIQLRSEKEQVTSVLGLVDPNGGSPREIARFANERLISPRWSPDAKTIAAVPTVIAAGVPRSIFLVASDGKGTRKVAVPREGFGLSSIAWSGAGDEVVYALAESATGSISGNWGSSAQVFRQNVRTGAVHRIFWSPYGAQLLEILGPGRLIFDTPSPRESLRELPLRGTSSAAGRWLTKGNSNDRQPAYSPDGEWVIFSSNRSGNLDLWELSTKTGTVRRFTEDVAEDWDPAFANGGKKVLWSSNRSGHFEIWMANADGSESRPVTQDGVDAENPTATPDGQWIIYVSGNPEKAGVWKIRQNGSQATRLVAGSVSLPEVSPDGQYASFVTNALPESVTLRVARVADGSVVFETLVPIRNNGFSGLVGRSRWMPDGKAIAFLGQDERGVNGVFVQDFVPAKDTAATRRRLGGFDPEIVTESFGISPHGERMTVASWEQNFSLVIAERVPGITPAVKASR